MFKREQTVGTFVPAQPQGLRETLAARAQQLAGTPYVIISEAKPVGIRQSVINWAMISAPVTVAVGLLIVALKLDGWMLLVAVLVLVAWQIPAGFMSAMFGNGQMLAWLTDRRWGKLASMQEHHRHAEEMVRLQIWVGEEKSARRIEHLELQLDALNRRLLTDAGGSPVMVESAYVANHPDPIRTMALTWAVTLYEGGRPDPGQVLPDGRLHSVTLPFSARGAWRKTESALGKAWLLEKEIILEVPGGYALNVERYPTLTSLGKI